MSKRLDDRLHRVTLLATWLFGLVLAVCLFLHATKPISNSDFWWHLKSGETMVTQQGLLHTDPFTFHPDENPTSREKVILKGYWLWQIAAFGLYSLLGFNGIFLLNLLTVGAIATCLAWQMQRFAINWGVAAPLLTMGFTLFRNYDLERPTSATFLCAVILMGLLCQACRGGRLGLALPAVMCLWANLHGGFVVGDLMLACFALGAVIEYRHDRPRVQNLLLWAAAGIVASFLNPNGPLALIEVFNFIGKPIQTGIVEYNSTWSVFREGSTVVVILWLLVALYFLGVTLSRRIYWPEFLIAIFLAWFSISYQRNIAFFSLAMLPAIGLTWREAAQRGSWRLPAATAPMAIVITTALLLWPTQAQWRGQRGAPAVAQIYPEAGIDFLEKSKLEGRMFNSYEYGGYLLWRLGPRMKIFIDGRGLDEQVYADYGKISAASHVLIHGRREYEVLLDQYGIDYVIQPIYDGYGNVQPLMKVLLGKADWRPVYLDSQVYVLARSTAGNDKTISSLAFDKEEFKARLLLTYSSLCNSYPQEVGFRVARAGMLIYLGRYQEAKAEVDTIASFAPGEKMLPNLRRELNLLAGRMHR